METLEIPDHKSIGFTISDTLLRQTPAALHIECFRIARIKMKPGHAMLAGLILNGRHELSRHADAPRGGKRVAGLSRRLQ